MPGGKSKPIPAGTRLTSVYFFHQARDMIYISHKQSFSITLFETVTFRDEILESANAIFQHISVV
jgi:hypothetical protein